MLHVHPICIILGDFLQSGYTSSLGASGRCWKKQFNNWKVLFSELDKPLGHIRSVVTAAAPADCFSAEVITTLKVAAAARTRDHFFWTLPLFTLRAATLCARAAKLPLPPPPCWAAPDWMREASEGAIGLSPPPPWFWMPPLFIVWLLKFVGVPGKALMICECDASESCGAWFCGSL